MKKVLDFFYYTKSERKACVLLVVLCSLVFMLPEWLDVSPRLDLTVLADAPRPVQVNRPSWPTKKKYFKPYAAQAAKTMSLFPFDPNTVGQEELQQLGLSARTAAIWVKYASKGGRFRKPEDVLKVFGLPHNWYPKVEPYIQIASLKAESYSSSFKDKTDYPDYPTTRPAKNAFKPCSPIDINTADTSAWQSLRGIGKVLAARIIKFRDKLGGFYTLDQVRETYGLADSVFQKIAPCLQLGPSPLKPLLINQATLNELASHPYIGFKAAKGLLNWKDQHGPFSKPEDLEAVVALERSKLERLRPYVQF